MSPVANKFVLKAALRDLDNQGIEIGTVVTVTWTIPESHATEGGTQRSQTGPLAYLDREKGYYQIEPTVRSPGHYRGYLLAQYSTLTKAEDQDVRSIESKPANPFLKEKPEPKQRPVKRSQKPMVNPFTKGK